jgi:hypothetical protein
MSGRIGITFLLFGIMPDTLSADSTPKGVTFTYSEGISGGHAPVGRRSIPTLFVPTQTDTGRPCPTTESDYHPRMAAFLS